MYPSLRRWTVSPCVASRASLCEQRRPNTDWRQDDTNQGLTEVLQISDTDATEVEDDVVATCDVWLIRSASGVCCNDRRD